MRGSKGGKGTEVPLPPFGISPFLLSQAYTFLQAKMLPGHLEGMDYAG